jgi:hypothetical protein
MKFIPAGVTRFAGRKTLVVQKNAPGILMVAGIVGSIASTVLACRATLKLEKTLDEIQKDVDQVEHKENAHEFDHDKAMMRVYIHGTYKIVKLYAPAMIIGVASIGCLTKSRGIQNNRYAALSAGYSALQASYDAYRERVRNELGEEKELEFYHAIEVEQIGRGGKLEKFKRADPNRWSPYAKMFDESNVNWKKTGEANRLFIQAQQNYCNHLLHSRGHVFLNEAYDLLDIPRTPQGQIVGWVRDNGDNFVDFGIYEAGNANFVNGYEVSIILDFNVDGQVYDLI